jgi:hypothetical protein
MMLGALKIEAQLFNRSALSGIAVPGIVSPKINNDYHPGWGVHYSACEMPSNVYAGSAINSITFKLNTPVPVSAPFQVRLKLRNTGDTNPLCQIQYPKSWEEASNLGVNPIWCTGDFDPTQSTLKLTLPPGAFVYQGGGLEILRDSATADHYFSMKGYYDQQNMALWDANNMKYLLNYKPIIKINAVPPTSAPAPSLVSIQNCAGASTYTTRQSVCFYLYNWRLTQTQIANSSNTYQWRIYSATDLVTSLLDVSTPNSYIELTTAVLSGLTPSSSGYILKCVSQINPNVPITSFLFHLTEDVSTTPTSAPIGGGSIISRVKIGKKTPEMSVYLNMMESESYSTNLFFSRRQLNLPFENIAIGNVATDASPVLYANSMQNNIPEFEPGDMMRLELTMNKAMKPMLNHRSYFNFDWDGDQKYDSLITLTLANSSGNYQLPQGLSGSGIVTLTGSTSSEILYTTDIFIPCDRIKNIPIKFLSGLQRLPTGWNEREEYTIKTLCPTPLIAYSGADTVCVNAVLPFTASVPSGCIGTYEWFDENGQSVETGSSFTPTTSGTYTVKFTTEDCIKSSLPITIVILPLVVQYADADGDGYGDLNADTLSCDTLDGYVLNGNDCNDANALLHTVSVEICNGFDDDCDGIIDNGLLTTYYEDADGDGYGAGIASNLCANPGAGYSTSNNDCNDGASTIHPGAAEVCNAMDDDCDGTADDGLTFVNYYNDADGDGYGSGVASNLCSNPGAGYATNNTDCNEGSATIHPGAAEVCNAMDDDCDGTSDDGLTFVNYYSDVDGDGYGSGVASNLCSNPGAGYATNNTDCNDAAPTIHPGATEVCNAIDDDCNGTADDGLTFVNYYNDADGDGYGSGVASNLCANPGAGYSTSNNDCNDGASTIHPGAAEVCNAIDDDCDATADDGLTFVNYYNDVDGDGYGSGVASNLCANPGAGYVTNNTDCNDGAATIHPGATEVCNAIDDDCDGTADDGLTFVNYYNDADGDGYGAGVAINLCANPGAGYVTNNTDCNDGAATIHPGAAEVCNAIDDDCDGTADDGLTFVNYYNDADGDGFGAGTASNLCTNPGAGYVTNNTDCNDGNPLLNSISPETCNGFDDDCDGTADDGLTFVNYYNDADVDGNGAGAASNLCANPGLGYATNNTDCNDGSATIHPGATEVCNAIDDDCDGTADDGLTFVNYYNDSDGDGYGAGAASNLCANPGLGYVTNNTDCNDGAATIHPGAAEVCNSIDDDCDGITDEGCSLGGGLSSAITITTLPQFGLTGGNYSQNVNMTLEADTPENGGTYPEKWFKFVAQSNAVRIAVSGAASSDDNAIMLYDDPGFAYSTPLIPLAVEDDVNLSSIGVGDNGNETLLTDQLVEGNTYYVAVATVAGAPGTINVKFNTLLPSSCDIAIYTGGTNTFSNVCSNFKCRYRQNAKRGIVHRWSSSTITGMPLQSYTIPPTTIMFTVCQLSKFVPANISAAPQTIYVSADVQYELLDAAGNMNYLTAISNSTCNFTLNPEPYINLRSSDACPNFKSTASSIATDRSVCGSSQYQWEFTQAFPVVGLPYNVNGSLGGSRILNVSGIPGITNGQRYDVRIRSRHNDNVTYSGWSSTPSCFKTLGAAGMTPWTEFDTEHPDERDGFIIVYPNPSLVGSKAKLQTHSEMTRVDLYSNSGQLLARLEGLSEMKSIELPVIEASGLYWVVVHSGNDSHRIAWLIQ